MIIGFAAASTNTRTDVAWESTGNHRLNGCRPLIAVPSGR